MEGVAGEGVLLEEMRWLALQAIQQLMLVVAGAFSGMVGTAILLQVKRQLEESHFWQAVQEVIRIHTRVPPQPVLLLESRLQALLIPQAVLAEVGVAGLLAGVVAGTLEAKEEARQTDRAAGAGVRTT